MKIFCLRKEIYQASQAQVYGQERVDKLKLWVNLRQAGQDTQEAAKLLKCSRSTLYRWAARLHQHGLPGLQHRSCRPHAQRQKQWSAELVAAVCKQRRQHPLWGKLKITAVLKAQGIPCSQASVGRILSQQMRGHNPVLQRQLRCVSHPI